MYKRTLRPVSFKWRDSTSLYPVNISFGCENSPLKRWFNTTESSELSHDCQTVRVMIKKNNHTFQQFMIYKPHEQQIQLYKCHTSDFLIKTLQNSLKVSTGREEEFAQCVAE